MGTNTLYIIDLDGTLYDNRHRAHLVPKDKTSKEGWLRFNAACLDDTLREDVASLVRLLVEKDEVAFLTGRMTETFDLTYYCLTRDFPYGTFAIYMRDYDDTRCAADFKRAQLQEIKQASPGQPIIVIEDDPTVVEALRKIEGVTVMQVDSLCAAVADEDKGASQEISVELNPVTSRAVASVADFSWAYGGCEPNLILTDDWEDDRRTLFNNGIKTNFQVRRENRPNGVWYVLEVPPDVCPLPPEDRESTSIVSAILSLFAAYHRFESGLKASSKRRITLTMTAGWNKGRQTLRANGELTDYHIRRVASPTTGNYSYVLEVPDQGVLSSPHNSTDIDSPDYVICHSDWYIHAVRSVKNAYRRGKARGIK